MKIAPVLALSVALLALAPPASAQSLYNTSRILQELGNECLGASGCTTLRDEPLTVAVGASMQIPLQCPADHPYLWGWDARRNENIIVNLIPSSVTSSGLTLAATNKADAPGSVVVFLGCGAKQPSQTALMERAGALPTNLLAIWRNLL